MSEATVFNPDWRYAAVGMFWTSSANEELRARWQALGVDEVPSREFAKAFAEAVRDVHASLSETNSD